MSYLTSEQWEMVNENRKLLHFTIKKFPDWEIGLYGYDDLIEEGLFGLIEAVKKFDDTKCGRFSTFAVKCIFNAMCGVRQANSTKGRKHGYEPSLDQLAPNGLRTFAELVPDPLAQTDQSAIAAAEIDKIYKFLKKQNKTWVLDLIWKKFDAREFSKKFKISEVAVHTKKREALNLVRNYIGIEDAI